MRRYRFLSLYPLLLALSMSAVHAAEVTSVDQVDISRYAGEWHEIARLPNTFQQDCAGMVTAQYTLRDDGMIGVRNACNTQNGSTESVEGVARRVQGHPGRLEVRFAPEWLRWVPFVWGDYWVIGLDPEYQWAIVGEPDREYLWILSRSPQMNPTQLDAIKKQAIAMGYDLDELIVNAAAR